MLGLVIQKGQGGLCRQRQQVKECHVNINYTKKVEVTASFFFLKVMLLRRNTQTSEESRTTLLTQK